MNQATKVWDLWSRFWFERPAVYSLAAFRILFGVYLFGYVSRDAFRVELLYSQTGVYSPYLMPDIAPGAGVATLIYASWLALTLLFMLGVRTRIVTPLLFAAHLYHYGLNIAVVHTSFDRLNLLFLLYLCFGSSDRVWSVSAWLAKRAGHTIHPAEVSASTEAHGRALEGSNFASRLIQMQLAVFYFGVGLWKLLNPLWHSGDILFYNFIGMWAMPAGFWVIGLGLPSWLLDLSAWSVTALELSLGFALFVKRLRPFAVLAGATFQISIYLTLDFPEFFVCIFAYVLYFDDETIRGAVDRVRRFFRLEGASIEAT